jgi:hypothetical protein
MRRWLNATAFILSDHLNTPSRPWFSLRVGDVESFASSLSEAQKAEFDQRWYNLTVYGTSYPSASMSVREREDQAHLDSLMRSYGKGFFEAFR